MAERDARVEDLLAAMRAIEHGLHDDKGDYFKLRAYLDKHGRYHGNLQCEAVMLEVAQVAIAEAELILAQTAPTGWLSVTDHPPEIGRNCLVVIDGIVQKTSATFQGAEDGWEFASDWGDNAPANIVTHWMPLPTAPTVPAPVKEG